MLPVGPLRTSQWSDETEGAVSCWARCRFALLGIVLSLLTVGCDLFPTERTVVEGEFEGLAIGAGKDETFGWLQSRGHTLVGAYLVSPARATSRSELGVLGHAEAIVVRAAQSSEGVSVTVRFGGDVVNWSLVSVPIRDEYGHYFVEGASRERVLQGIDALMNAYRNLEAFESIPLSPKELTTDISLIDGITDTPLAEFDLWRVSYVDKERKRSQSLQLYFGEGGLDKIIFRSSPGY